MVLRERVLRELLGGLWHETHPDRFEMIIRSGATLPEPDIPESGHWNTLDGPKYHPYVRTIGGVSLFEFDGFDPEDYRREHPTSSWFNFVPCRTEWGSSVWIEIYRKLVAAHIVSPSDLAARQNGDPAHRWRKRMAQIEAAHLGPLPRTAFKRAFLVRDGDSELHALAC